MTFVASLHEEDAKVLLKPSQCAADRGSGYAQLPCRSSQRARLCDGNKRTDIVEIEVIHNERLLPVEPNTALRWRNSLLRQQVDRSGSAQHTLK